MTTLDKLKKIWDIYKNISELLDKDGLKMYMDADYTGADISENYIEIDEYAIEFRFNKDIHVYMDFSSTSLSLRVFSYHREDYKTSAHETFETLEDAAAFIDKELAREENQ